VGSTPPLTHEIQRIGGTGRWNDTHLCGSDSQPIDHRLGSFVPADGDGSSELCAHRRRDPLVFRHHRLSAEQARTGSLDDASAALLNGIESSMELADRVEDPFAFVARAVRKVRRALASWLPANRARRLTRIAMAFFCVLGLIPLGLLVASAFTSDGLRQALTIRDQPVGEFGQIVLIVTWALNVMVTVLAGLTWWALRQGRVRRRLALRCGYGAMLLMLLLGNLLSSYVDQFAVLAEATLQIIAIGLLARWDHATRSPTVA
jgi:hypothetical protein